MSLSQGIAYTLCSLHLLSWVIQAPMTTRLALVPEFTLVTRFYFWNLATCMVYEPFLPFAVVAASTVYFLGPAVEARWGWWGTFRYLLTAHFCASISSFFAAYIWYVAGGHEDALVHFFTGGPALVAALVVATKQAYPDEKLWLGVKPTYLPLATILSVWSCERLHTRTPVVVSATTSSAPSSAVMALVPGSALPSVLVSTLVCWAWLRFLHPHPPVRGGLVGAGGWDPNTIEGDALVGDTTESFALHNCFPPVLRPPVRLISALAYALVRLCGCCTDWHCQYTARLSMEAILEEELLAAGCVVPSGRGGSGLGSLVGTSGDDAAERRRIVEELERRLERTLRGKDQVDTFDMLL